MKFKSCAFSVLLLLASPGPSHSQDPTTTEEGTTTVEPTTTVETPTTTVEPPTTTTTTTVVPPTTTTTAVTTTPVPFPRTRCPVGESFTCRDCQNLLVCDGQTNVIGTMSCARNNPRTPYCNNNRCSDQEDIMCLRPSALCPAGNGGFYPHPFNCNRYNVCTANRQAFELVCPQNWVYNAGLKGCRPRSQASDCVQANCGGQANRFVPYTGDTSLYVFCGGGANNALLQCAAGEIFDPVMRSCGAQVCTAEGLIAYPGDTSKYYVCVDDGNGGFKYYVGQCPPPLVFDATNERCSPSTRLRLLSTGFDYYLE